MIPSKALDADELGKAADRVRRSREEGWMAVYTERPMFGHQNQQMEDWRLLAAAYLAGHLPDDGEPFTRENVPPWWTAELEGRFGDAMEAFEKDPFSVLTTWGRVRQLLAFLGIDLTEKEQ